MRARQLRMLVRRAFYVLPGRWQLRFRQGRRAVLRQYDWAPSVKRLRLKEAEFLTRTATAQQARSGRRRIAIYSLHHSSPIEYGLATALRLRGHDVIGVLCDGLLPLCELSLGPTVRPPCAACIMHFARYEDAFGFDYSRLTDFLSQADRDRAEQLVSLVSDEELADLQVDGVPVGRLARRELQRYYRGFVFDPSRDPAYRRWLVTGVLLTWFSGRWLDHVRPDIVGICSGRTLPTACAFEVARQRGIRVVTWDGAATRPDSLTFSHNLSATEIPLDEAWREASTQELTDAQCLELDEFLERWSRSEDTPFPYNRWPSQDAEAIKQRLGLRPDSCIVAAFTNTAWDIAVIDRDVGFDSMFDWLFALVEYAIDHPEMTLVVRAHPAERTAPAELRSRTPVAAEVRKRYSPLPDNIRLVEGDTPINSYTLAGLADVNMVYASRFGLELAVRGLRPWIAGAVTYRGKGFTLDLESKAQMIELLDGDGAPPRLSKEEIELAQRFAYLWFFRYEVRLPLLRPPGKRFELDTFRTLGPGGDESIDRLCDAFVAGSPFIDIAGR